SCLSIIPTSSLSSLFPYTTLFRSSFGNTCFRSAGNHHFSLTPPDVVQCIHNSGVGSSTGGNGGVVNAHQPVFHGNESRGHIDDRSEEHTSELQSRFELVCCVLLER